MPCGDDDDIIDDMEETLIPPERDENESKAPGPSEAPVTFFT